MDPDSTSEGCAGLFASTMAGLLLRSLPYVCTTQERCQSNTMMLLVLFVTILSLLSVGGCNCRHLGGGGLSSTSTRQPSAAFFFAKPTGGTAKSSSGGAEKEELLLKLQTLIDTSQNGIDTSNNDEIKSVMTQIANGISDDQRKNLAGRWELIYTTEKEVNFFRTSWPFAKVTSIVQEIDIYDTQSIQNSINFERDGAFVVNGIASPATAAENNDTTSSDYDRVEFEFQTAYIKVFGKTFDIPPVGAGWFDTMYVDDTYRLSNDSRDDWSVFRRIV